MQRHSRPWACTHFGCGKTFGAKVSPFTSIVMKKLSNMGTIRMTGSATSAPKSLKPSYGAANYPTLIPLPHQANAASSNLTVTVSTIISAKTTI
jgi:hypothetical protein